MRMRLPLILAAFGAGLALGACEVQTTEPAEQAPPPPVEAPSAEEEADDAAAEEPAEPTQQPAPPPTDTGDMGEARTSEESVAPDSETIFY